MTSKHRRIWIAVILIAAVISIGGLLADTALLWFVWSMCKVAGDADERMGLE